jgi:hypothetical protein
MSPWEAFPKHKVMLEMDVECTAELRKVCLAENERSNISKQHA